MSNETKAFASLALMRDQKAVFGSVRAVLDTDDTDAVKLTKIEALYAAFDEAHPT